MKQENKVKTGFAVLSAAILLGGWGLFDHATKEKEAVKAGLEGQLTILTDRVIELESQLQDNKSLSLEDIDDFIMENPTVIVKSLAKLRFEQEQLAKQSEAELVKQSLDALYNDKNDPYLGNPNGKHVVVEFLDNNCGFCKKLSPTLKEFIAIDPEAKVIIKEYPIFQNQPTSAYSALMGTAVFYHSPEAYAKLHDLFMTNRLTREFIDQSIASLGITKEDLKPHLERAKKQLDTVRGLGARLRVSGTPTVFVGSEKIKGGMSAMELKAKFSN